MLMLWTRKIHAAKRHLWKELKKDEEADGTGRERVEEEEDESEGCQGGFMLTLGVVRYRPCLRRRGGAVPPWAQEKTR